MRGDLVVGYPLPEMLAQPTGERLVHAKEHAFISLAGVFGCSHESWSDNPLSELQTKSHLSEAVAKFALIARVPLPEAGSECRALILHVKRTFDDNRVQAATHALAKQFLKRRRLTGKEATAIIGQAWRQTNGGDATDPTERRSRVDRR